MEEHTFNAGDEVQVRGRKQKTKLAQEQWANDLRAVMGTAVGRRVMWAMFDRAGINRMSFNPGNPHWTDFNEGARNLGNQFFADVMAACPDLYLTAMKEANQKKEEENG